MKRRILLVDDDLAVLLTLKAVLELHGFVVDTAASTAEAFSRLESGVYQMVITDLCMETEDAGLEVVRTARRQSYDPATALLTAYPPSVSQWKQDPAQCLLVKPLGTANLIRQVEALLIQHEDDKQRRIRNRPAVTAPPDAERQAG
ncbi:MAG: response regulator [Terriglobales bacterium]